MAKRYIALTLQPETVSLLKQIQSVVQWRDEDEHTRVFFNSLTKPKTRCDQILPLNRIMAMLCGSMPLKSDSQESAYVQYYREKYPLNHQNSCLVAALDKIKDDARSERGERKGGGGGGRGG